MTEIIDKQQLSQISGSDALPHPKYTKTLVGHELRAKHLLDMFFTSRRFHHATIFSGSRGIGKATLVYHMLKIISMNANNVNEDVNTGYIDTIQDDKHEVRSILSDTNPDICIIESDDYKEISIDKIRKIHVFLAMKPVLMPHKFVIIDAIDNLNDSSSNAMLKILEEPPGQTYFFLINHNNSKILKTMLSRCMRFKISNVDFFCFSQIMKNNYANISHQDIQVASILSNNNPHTGMYLMLHNGINLYNSILKMIANNTSPDSSIMNAQSLNDEAHVIFSICIKRFLRACMLISIDKKIPILASELKTITSYLKARSLTNIQIIHRAELLLNTLHHWRFAHLNNEHAIIGLFRELLKC